MGNVQETKRRRSEERQREEGFDADRDMREDRKIPDFPDAGVATYYFMKLTPDYIAKHKDDKFRIAGRNKLSFVERDNLPAFSPDSVRTLGAGEGWQNAKRLLKNIIKGDTEALGEQFDQATRRGGYIMSKMDGGIIRNDSLMSIGSPIIKSYPFNKRDQVYPFEDFNDLPKFPMKNRYKFGNN